jgi:predicted transcriptional regulator
MNKPTRSIEVDEATAKALERRAAERGTTVAQFISELMVLDELPASMPEGDLAELDRRWAAIAAGERTVPHKEVVQWLQTWGTPGFKPWRDR